MSSTTHKSISYSSKSTIIDTDSGIATSVPYISYPSTSQTLGNSTQTGGTNPYLPIEMGFSSVQDIGNGITDPKSTFVIPYPNESNITPPFNVCTVEGIVFKNTGGLDMFCMEFPFVFASLSNPFPLPDVSPTTLELFEPSNYLKPIGNHRFFWISTASEFTLVIRYKDNISSTTVATMVKVTLI